MDIEAYSKLAIRTAPVETASLSGIVHAALGIGGESGERFLTMSRKLHITTES